MKRINIIVLFIALTTIFLMTGCFDSGSDNPAGLSENTTDNMPWVWISYPAQWGTVSGTEEVRVEAGPPEAVDSVLLFTDGVILGSDSDSPYRFSWPVEGLDGSHTLFARAFTDGDSLDSDLVTVSVADSSDNELPSVFITSPAVWETVRGTVPVLVEASDNRGVEKVVLLVE